MVNKSQKRLSVFLSSVFLSVTLGGICFTPPAQARLLTPATILVPLTLQALGYALPYINKKLTPQQRQKLQAVRSETYKQIETVFTQVQRSKIVQGLRSGENINTLIKSVKLTPNQKARIQSIVKTSRQKINAIVSESPSASK